ncbi:transmembrane protein [Rhynchospora pubera]|uniref:Transmembrane protein n=1 Tax=Rhynchospora pubera TaxID=906938 RepID=A0AAV8EIN0_9POAL|nr:transmembrane protein [Rhynchospora pubera]
MGFVIVISLPLILFSILMGFGCYYYGKRKGREEMRTGVGSQVYGTPLTPPGAAGSSPPQVKFEKERVDNI